MTAWSIFLSVVTHLAKELSHFIRYILFHGARTSVRVMNTHHRRSLSVLGGLEIPNEVTIEMDQSKVNETGMKNMKESNKEPGNEKLEDATCLRDLKKTLTLPI